MLRLVFIAILIAATAFFAYCLYGDVFAKDSDLEMPEPTWQFRTVPVPKNGQNKYRLLPTPQGGQDVSSPKEPSYPYGSSGFTDAC